MSERNRQIAARMQAMVHRCGACGRSAFEPLREEDWVAPGLCSGCAAGAHPLDLVAFFFGLEAAQSMRTWLMERTLQESAPVGP